MPFTLYMEPTAKLLLGCDMRQGTASEAAEKLTSLKEHGFKGP